MDELLKGVNNVFDLAKNVVFTRNGINKKVVNGIMYSYGDDTIQLHVDRECFDELSKNHEVKEEYNECSEYPNYLYFVSGNVKVFCIF